MSFFSRLQLTEEADKSRAVQRLITESTPDFDFFFFVVLAVLMATLGLILNSAAVVIGSMLIAPILYPILSLSLGLVMSDYVLFYRSFYTIVKSFVLAVGLSLIATLFFVQNFEPNFEILSRTEPSIAYFMIAIISGLAVAYSLARPGVNETLPGIAVSVALLPPMAVVGIGLATLDLHMVLGSLSLFALNVLGILFASMFSFSMMNLYTKKHVASKAIQKEEERVEEEKKAVEEMDEKQKNGKNNTNK